MFARDGCVMTATARPAGRVPLPRIWPVRPSDLVAIVVGNGLLIAAMWVRHGNLAELDSLGGILTAGGQLTALLATYLVLIELVLMARLPWLDQLFGADRLVVAHRWTGFGAVALILAHGVLSTVGYALGDGSTVVGEAITLLTTYPYVLMATVSGALFVMVALTSVRLARSAMSHETWYGLHLYAYLAVALGFAHQLAVGVDFQDDPMARVYWIGLYVAVVGLIIAFRIAQPAWLSWRHRLRVADVVREAPGVVSVYVTGRDLDRLAVRSGQHFYWRLLTRDRWWRAHPFSLSAAPNGRYLRFTAKQLGDFTERLQGLRPGVRIAIEGPYGNMTGAVRARRRVVLIGAGIGITPLRALLEALPYEPGDLTLLYRAERDEDLAFHGEIDAIARRRGAVIHYLVGPRVRRPSADPLGPSGIRRLVPDIAARDVYLCGPLALMDMVRRGLRSLGVPDDRVHAERFEM
jgi:predicted ferric reductase